MMDRSNGIAELFFLFALLGTWQNMGDISARGPRRIIGKDDAYYDRY